MARLALADFGLLELVSYLTYMYLTRLSGSPADVVDIDREYYDF